ncbi:MAG: Tm-1-like ATP-binding domain-containing protein [Dethiobacteria bacterium]
MKTILIVSVLDTKGVEVAFLRDQIKAFGANVMVMDCGILGEPYFKAEITREEVAGAVGLTHPEVQRIPSEGEALGTMIEGAIKIAKDLYREGKFDGVLSLGGAMGTGLGSAVMRALPFGVPKVMISTVAAVGDVVSAAVGTKDILMYHSVTDVAGLNRLTRKVFTNAAAAVVGMVNTPQEEKDNKKLVAISTLGTTEKAASGLRDRLATRGFETVTFHTTGVGGTALEGLLGKDEDVVDGGVIEISLHEWIDRIAGGLYQAQPDRYENAGKKGLPQVYVPGSADFIVHGPGQEKFKGRVSHPHNAAITLYRTSREEFAELGRVLAEKVNKSLGPVAIVIPMKGFCVHDREGGPLYDPDANMGFVEAVEANVNDDIVVKRVDAYVLDEDFMDAVIDTFLEISQEEVPKAG